MIVEFINISTKLHIFIETTYNKNAFRNCYFLIQHDPDMVFSTNCISQIIAKLELANLQGLSI